VGFADQAIGVLDQLEADRQSGAPWLVVCSFVNPHDITLYGFFGALGPGFDFSIDPGVPAIPPSPTDDQSLITKPICHASYRRTYTQAFQPTFNTQTYRQLYYQLHQDVDAQILRVFRWAPTAGCSRSGTTPTTRPSTCPWSSTTPGCSPAAAPRTC
jgi:hypothetical protein